MASNIVDIGQTVVGGVSLAPQSLAAGTINGNAIDTISGQPELNCHLILGALTVTSIAVQMQEAKEDPANLGSPLASDWSNIVAPTNGSSAIAAQTTGNQDIWLGIRTNVKRFIRPVFTVVGAGSVLTAFEIYAQARIAPTNAAGFSISPQV